MLDRSNPRRKELLDDIIEKRANDLFDKIDCQKMTALVQTNDPIVKVYTEDAKNDKFKKVRNGVFSIASLNKSQSGKLTPGFGLIVIPKTNLKYFGEMEGVFGQKIGNGSLEGLGILTVDDTYYRGYLRDGKQEGLGFFVEKDWKYHGQFKDGKRHGMGELIFHCGVWYLGDFADDLMDGMGHYYIPDGDDGGLKGRDYVPNKDDSGYKYQYRGQFQKGLFHGFGTYETFSHKITGKFRNGVMEFVTMSDKELGTFFPMIIPHKIMGKDYRGEVVICPNEVLNAQLSEFAAVYVHISEVGKRLSMNLESHRGGYKMW